MKSLSTPVAALELCSELNEIPEVLQKLMGQLRHVFDNSNFYKELRIVSFFERLLVSVQSKIEGQISFEKALDHEVIVDEALNVVKTFQDNFWLEKNENSQKEETKTEMQQSFYRKEGLEFLYFQRPGTVQEELG